ncbi:hypothetical protein PHYBLDRAFT_146809 [Phycomyces blakesleeanus NRRL 1555(-)]|uniref:Uncharacterized protein n=1 Tax=Phycomyces blakesleeanus (strain ATCC 8743b / DSM 1359 / FGSC 10004 / NBRC 33097 / NRRL 1555) TaxID=763407 RepID=A0A162X5M9_PHYB8|nr:hypothetical protein PHYBLDRAFT_146809 [Phycomyces blakesleeanus NRRL 1555(-)]OAD72625.1 hypothetical protein PHYBLDRAFT_146809 [Phycomyces blakesleeanus NRRL 1555(-)]|eukprot:XP_018290665.1 hypothetical protein PHYBLDRAFT_146809 [Phycomyces blakesleeanus NRRL 1555(-)]
MRSFPTNNNAANKRRLISFDEEDLEADTTAPSEEAAGKHDRGDPKKISK